MSSSKLFLGKNSIDNRWKVTDADGFAFGDGETPEEAIASARIVSNAPIVTYWGIVPSGEFELHKVGE